MEGVSGWLLTFGVLLICIAFADAVWKLITIRQWHRLDIGLLAAVLVLPPLLRGSNPYVLGARFALTPLLPYALFRIIRHFRDVSRWISGTLLVLSAASAAAIAFTPRALYLPAVSTTYIVTALALGFAVITLSFESRRAIGIKRRRLWLASLGTVCFGITFGLSSVTTWFEVASATNSFMRTLPPTLEGIGLICYYFAFSTPRPLLSRWRKAEQAKYLAGIAGREPEERGRRAADDLFQATLRTIGGATTFIAVRDEPGQAELVIRGSSHAELTGCLLAAGDHLLTRVDRAGRPAFGRPAECEPDIVARLPPGGVQVLVAPICAGAHVWGVVAAVHRRGALFPDDDLSMLAQLARDAATSLDHAQLIIERREQVRRLADQRLRDVKSLVASMLHSIKDYALLVLDADGHVAEWQPGAERLFGHDRAQMTDHHAASVYDMTVGQLAEWLQEARTRGFAEREGTCRKLDGSTFIGASVIRPLVSETPGPAGFVVVTHDVTERRALEEQIRQVQKMEGIGLLAGGIAHDFNNLLTAIMGYAGYLEQDLEPATYRESVTEIQRAAERAAELTRQLLAFSRRKLQEPSRIDLCSLIDDFMPILRRMADGVSVTYAKGSWLPSVMGSRSQVEQIVMNLVVNGRDAMPGGGQVVIRTETAAFDESNAISGLPPGPYVVLEVSDTGTGMDVETRRRIFEPFFTTKEVGRGTGLGLAVVYGIVQEMHGAIQIDSELDRGTTFRLYFPEADAVGATTVLRGVHAFGAPRYASQGHETLLLVEDDEVTRGYLRGVLEGHGYRVIAAEHPSRALEITQSHGTSVDLVISDVVMPGSRELDLVQPRGAAHAPSAPLYISTWVSGASARSTFTAPRSLVPDLASPSELLMRIREILSAA